MKHIIFLLLALWISSCNDGELQIETIDFDSADLQFCGSSPEVSTRLFFKLNSDEALILELADGLLRNEPSEGTITSEVPSESRLSYRIFSANVSKNYFCDALPPASPSVREEIAAGAGQVLITTIRNPSDTTLYEHTVELNGISLVNSKGERITDLSINLFGTIITEL